MGVMADAIQINLGASNIGIVTGMTWDGLSRDVLETTTFSSAANWKEFVKGYKDAGEITFSGNYITDNATHLGDTAGGFIFDGFDSTIDATASTTITLTYMKTASTVGTHTCLGFVSSASISSNVNEIQTFSCTVKLTGAPTFNVS